MPRPFSKGKVFKRAAKLNVGDALMDIEWSSPGDHLDFLFDLPRAANLVALNGEEGEFVREVAFKEPGVSGQSLLDSARFSSPESQETLHCLFNLKLPVCRDCGPDSRTRLISRIP